MASEYSPFGEKKIDKLTAIDLAVLREVREGWYVEYKEALPSSKDIAKAISAFANTYGGWLLVGISELSKSDNVAGSFPGLKISDLDTSVQKIRQAASEHLNPTPHFETRIILGPCEQIGLPEGSGIICIRVPQSVLAPHIHSNGVIYRRVSDSSEPKAEADRHQLQLLWDRRSKVNEKYRRWIDRAPELSKSEEDRPLLRILLDGDLYGIKEGSLELNIREIGAVLNDTSSGSSLPMEAIFPSSWGIVARQTSSLTRHESMGVTWIVKSGLQSEVILPINAFDYDSPIELYDYLKKYKFVDRFIEGLEKAKSSDSRVVDLNQILAILLAISNTKIRLLRNSTIECKSIHVKVILQNVWRVVPFLDSSVILDRFEKFGLPLCLTSEASIPSGRDADGFFEILIDEDEDGKDSAVHYFAFHLFELVCLALGLEGVLGGNDKEEGAMLFRELREAWARSRSNGDDSNANG